MGLTSLLNKTIGLFQKIEFINKFFTKARTFRAIKSSRTVEHSWVLVHLSGADKKILDIGSTGALLPVELATIGYDVYSIDPRNYIEWHGTVHPNMKFVRGDVTQAPFISEHFDAVIAISTLEHIGTEDYFKTSVDESKDLQAISEVARILKEKGKFIFTVPYVKHNPFFVKYYDKERIEKLLNGLFKMNSEEYFCQKNGFWHGASPEEMISLGSKNGIVCIVATKTQSRSKQI